MAFARAGFAGFNYAGAAKGSRSRQSWSQGSRPRGSWYHDTTSRRAALDRLDMVATVLDTAFILPGTNVRFGIESMIRLVPGIGDLAASALSFYLLFEARRLGVPRLLLARMLGNVLIEGTIGAVPIAGDAFDVYFRANRRNIALLRKYFARAGY